MIKSPQTKILFWTIGIVTFCMAVTVYLFLIEEIFRSPSPTATESPQTIIDLQTLPTVATTPEIQSPAHTSTPIVSSVPSSVEPGKILFVSNRDGNEEIYVMELDGRNQTRLTQNPGRDIDPQWSPDGTKIAFLSERGNEIGLYVMNTDGSQQKLLTPSILFKDGEFSWAPDSTRVVYSSFIDNNSDLSVIDVRGSTEQNLTATDTQWELSSSWSPDGTKIAFYSLYLHEYFMINSDGSDLTKIVDVPSDAWSQPQWSPGGLYVLVIASSEIFSVNQKTSELTQLTNNQNYDASPAPSPDGRRIAFVSSRANGSHEVFIMSANGENAEKLSNIYDTRAYVEDVMWSPAGDRIFCTIGDYKGGVTPEIYSIDINTRETINLSQNPAYSNTLSDVAP